MSTQHGPPHPKKCKFINLSLNFSVAWLLRNRVCDLRYFVKITVLWCEKILKKTCINDITKTKLHDYDAEKKQINKLWFFVKITLSWRQKILQKYWKKHVLKTHLIHRFLWYSLEVDVGHLGADFGPLGVIFSLERQM